MLPILNDMKLPKIYWIALGTALTVALFQLLSLQVVAVNSDETLGLLLKDEIQKLLTTGTFSLHPILDYLGPADLWVLGSVYWITGRFFDGFGALWMVRLLPLLLFFIGAAVLYFELRRYRESLAHWFLLLMFLNPIALVYSRTAFPHSFFLGIFSILLAEAFRISRTREVRWWRIAFMGGLMTQFHTTAFVGFLAVFLPVLPDVLRVARAQPTRALGSAALYLLLASPVLMTFPPPVLVPAARSPSLALEIRNFVNVLSGYQPFVWLFRTELAPIVLVVLFFFILIFALFRQFQELRKGKEPLLLKYWWVNLALSLTLFFICYSGRSLVLVGHERYFIAIVPGWALLQADAFERLAKEVKRRWRFPPEAFAMVLALFLFGRFAIPVGRYFNKTDPNLSAARWLVEKCPRDRCLAYAENYWNYWAIRYYTRDRIDLNYYGHNWKTQEKHALKGREIASCWLTDEKLVYEGPYREKVEFPAQAAGFAQTCVTGTDPAFFGNRLPR